MKGMIPRKRGKDTVNVPVRFIINHNQAAGEASGLLAGADVSALVVGERTDRFPNTDHMLPTPHTHFRARRIEVGELEATLDHSGGMKLGQRAGDRRTAANWLNLAVLAPAISKVVGDNYNLR